MKIKKLLLFIFLGIFVHSTIADELKSMELLTLVKDGNPQATILISRTPARAAQLAAHEVQYYIEQITGAKLPIVDDIKNVKGIAIYIGDGNGIEKMGIDIRTLKNQEYLIRFMHGAIVLAGKDKDDRGKVDYRITDLAAIAGLPDFWDEQGTLYAAYDFLERYCNVRWFNPTEYGTFFPHVKTLTVESKDVQRTPTFSYRDVIGAIGDNIEEYDAYVSLWRNNASGEDFKAWEKAAYPELHKKYPQENFYRAAHKNMLHLFLLRMRNGGKIARCNHTMDGYVYRYWDRTSPLFMESRPEYFAKPLIANVRPLQVCFTNSGLIKQVVQDACDYYDRKGKGSELGIFWNPQLPNPFPVEPADNNFFCKCPVCQALVKANNSKGVKNPVEIFSTGIHSDYYFHFINEVAKGLNKARPGKEILTLAYMSHAKIPTFKLSPNVAVQFCFATNRAPHDKMQYENELALLNEWANDGTGRPLYLWLYYTFPLEFSWHGNYHCFPGFFAHTIDKQMKLFAQYGIRGMFHCGYGQDVEAYVTFKLMDNPALDIDVLLEDYFLRMYGRAARPMKELYLDMERVYSNPRFRPNGKISGVDLSWRYLGTEERMRRYGELLAEAEKLADTDSDKKRIELFKKAVWNYMCYGRQNYLNPNKFPIPKVPEIVVSGGKTISDSFSQSQLGPMWKIGGKHGPMQSPDFGGTMIFPNLKTAKAAVILPDYKQGTPCAISFDLCHTFETSGSHVTVKLSGGNITYYVQMSSDTGTWGNNDTAGLYIYEKNELSSVANGRIGAKGSALSSVKNEWETILLKFDSVVGLTFSQIKKNGETTNFVVKNDLGMSKIDKIEFDISPNFSGWHLDNFKVQYTPVP